MWTFKNMTTHDTAVYIGAGLDFIPVFKFREIRNFIYVDCMPLFSSDTPYMKDLARPKFPMELYQTMRRLGFKKIISDEADLDIYVNSKNGVTIKYYTNLRFPNDKGKGSFLYEVKNASVLICCGHTADRSIINYMKPGPKMFIGNNKTHYNSECDDNGVDLAIAEEPAIFETYYKFSIPSDYEYWDHESVDPSDFIRFQVTKHDSLKDLWKKI